MSSETSYTVGKLTGKVVKTERKKKHETISFASKKDLKNMSAAAKLKFGGRLRDK
jgi:predicted lipoprotein